MPPLEARVAEWPEVTMEQVGKTFVFDYGEMVIRVRYLSDKKLAWEQIKGPAVGLVGEEDLAAFQGTVKG